MQGIRLDAKLKGQGSSLAQIIRSAQCSRSYVDPLLQSASTEAAALHIKRLPVPGAQRRKWVNRLYSKFLSRHVSALHDFKSHTPTTDSDCLMVASLGHKPGQAQLLQRLIPSYHTRVALHRLKLGALPFLKSYQMRRLFTDPVWRSLDAENKFALGECECGHSPQTVQHLLHDCPLGADLFQSGLPRKSSSFLTVASALQPSITNQLHFQTVYGNLCTVREQLGVTQAQYQHHIAQVGLLSLLPAPVT